MRSRSVLALAAALFVTAGAAPAWGQALPTSQPNVVEIAIEEVKVGHAADHETNEAGWAAAFARTKHPYSYLALESLTGRPQVWFTSGYESHAAIGNSLRLTTENKELAGEIGRLSRLDAEHVEGVRIVQARARPDLSHGTYPDIGTQRFWEITLFRLRPGFDEAFATVAKAYAASAKRNAPKAAYRVYEVIAGLPAPTYIIFASFGAFAELDAAMTTGDATMKGMSPQEMETLTKLGPGLVSIETQRFRLNPKMSYVPADVRAKDPKFWTSPP